MQIAIDHRKKQEKADYIFDMKTLNLFNKKSKWVKGNTISWPVESLLVDDDLINDSTNWDNDQLRMARVQQWEEDRDTGWTEEEWERQLQELWNDLQADPGEPQPVQTPCHLAWGRQLKRELERRWQVPNKAIRVLDDESMWHRNADINIEDSILLEAYDKCRNVKTIDKDGICVAALEMMEEEQAIWLKNLLQKTMGRQEGWNQISIQGYVTGKQPSPTPSRKLRFILPITATRGSIAYRSAPSTFFLCAIQTQTAPRFPSSSHAA